MSTWQDAESPRRHPSLNKKEKTGQVKAYIFLLPHCGHVTMCLISLQPSFPTMMDHIPLKHELKLVFLPLTCFLRNSNDSSFIDLYTRCCCFSIHVGYQGDRLQWVCFNPEIRHEWIHKTKMIWIERKGDLEICNTFWNDHYFLFLYFILHFWRFWNEFCF